MFELGLILTGVVAAASALIAYSRTKDAFHPAVILAPILGYVYSLWPLLLDKDGGIQRLLGEGNAEYVALLYAAGIACFFAGLLRNCTIRRRDSDGNRIGGSRSIFHGSIDASQRRQCLSLALLLGAASVASYLYMLSNVGGFAMAYSVAKGGGRAPSGYIGEAVLLSFPAVVLLALSRQGTGQLRIRDVLLAIVILAPHIIQGTFGGRRGPLFLALSVMLFGWFLVRGRRPRALPILVGLFAIGACVVLLQSQRRHFYLGSEGEFEVGRMTKLIGVGDETHDLKNNDYVAGASTVLTADYYGDFYWGYRYLVTVFVRPIPRQLWPSKYEDVNARWLNRWDPEEGGGDLLQAVGFLPPEGSSVGFLADIYYEFSWGMLIVVYLFGRGLAGLWRRHCEWGGLWSILFIDSMILGIYIPTQSFSAWFHRFLIMTVVTLFLWRYWFRGHSPAVTAQDRPIPSVPRFSGPVRP